MSTTAKELFIVAVQNIGILQGLQYFALLQEKVVQGRVDFARVIGENETISSVVTEGDSNSHSHRDITRLCIRKVIFLDDSMAFVQPYHVMLKFVFYQAVADVRKNIHFCEEDMAELGAIHLKIHNKGSDCLFIYLSSPSLFFLL